MRIRRADLGVRSSRARIAPEVWATAEQQPYLQRILDLITAVNAEDRPVIEGVWQALHHHGAPRGPFSYLERNVYDIDRYLAERLTR